MFFILLCGVGLIAMQGHGGLGFASAGALVKKPRSDTPRQRRQYPQSLSGVRSSSSTPSSGDVSKLSSDRIVGHDSGNRKKELHLNKPAPRSSSVNKIGVANASIKIKKESRTFRALDELHGDVSSKGGLSSGNQHVHKGSDLKLSSKTAPAATNLKGTNRVKVRLASHSTPDDNMSRNGDGHNVLQSGKDSSVSSDTKPRKVKLKIVRSTALAKSNEETGSGDNQGPSSVKRECSSDITRQQKKSTYQDNSDSLPDKKNGLIENQRKAHGGSFSREAKKDSRDKATEESLSRKHADNFETPLSSDPVRKSNRVPKRRFLDNAFDQAQDDDEIRYLEGLRASKFPSDRSVEDENNGEDVKKRKLSKISKSKSSAEEVVQDYGFPKPSKDSRKMLKPGRESDDTDYFEEEESVSDADPESKSKRQKKVLSPDPGTDGRSEPLRTRQRALQSGKGTGSASAMEFPDGLPPPPSRKHKEKLSEEEQLARKAEAAQRRKLQVEKQAKELQEEAIRKILGLDSDKKKEEKKQKEQEEKAKAAKLQESAANTIRWIIGPTGTVVVFPEDVGLPSIFEKKPCSYPPPREKCAGPSCTNPYKYRDSKSNLPLCSLQCYKAVQGNPHPMTMC